MCSYLTRTLPSLFLFLLCSFLFFSLPPSVSTQESLNIDGVRFEIFDVGGQRNERRKWIHAFDDVTSLIFVAAISEYDQVLEEDDGVNRLTEALAVFQQSVNNSSFHSMPVILFLNKFDIFRDKVAHQSRDPAQCEPALWGDYAGGSGR